MPDTEVRLCSACRGYREHDGTVHLAHEEPCHGHTNAGGSTAGTSPRCTCPCTPQDRKDELEREHNYRSWLKLSHVHTILSEVQVTRPDYPLEDELHLTFVQDPFNHRTVRLTDDVADHLVSLLIQQLKHTRFLDTGQCAVYVAHAIRKARDGAKNGEISRELPMGLDGKVLDLLMTADAAVSS